MSRPTMTGNRFSVCIGINRYQPESGLSSLQYAEGDAQAMDSLLGQLDFEKDNRCLLLGEAATLDAVNDALSTMILDRPGVNDLVVFYFAGHSLPLTINEREVQNGAEPRSEVFLTTYDFDREKIKQRPSFRKQHALGMERLRKDFFEGEGSRKRLFLFDSCYSGDFFGPRYRDEDDPVQGYIKHMLDSSSSGRVAISSCLPVQKAVEDPALGHGQFTYYLLDALSGKAQEALRHDGCITVNSLFDYLANQLPLAQRPVLSGVQQDTFELVCYKNEHTGLPIVEAEGGRRIERETRLRAMFADHSGFMSNRLSSFVGRVKELREIRQRITTMLLTGGYITITGQAGQGKSCIIAKLVEEYSSEKPAYHFIPFNPGPDYQVSLLRDLMARLILKYDLFDLYAASENRAALRDYLPKVLAEIVAKGGQEVIFIDGLDQLKEDMDGERDLSFLPNNPPPGIVFVLGTRPNDTLRPLELLKPHNAYPLPNLSRQDFDLLLEHRKVKLDRLLADQFYNAMQENALYLDLVAQELAQEGTASPEDIIKRVADNPNNIFSLSLARLKRQGVEWRNILKPILGVLLVAREPLAKRHIRQVLEVDDERLGEGLARLGGLVADDGRQRYSLFHLKLLDYLRLDESKPHKEYIFAKDEEEGWHKKLVDWCEAGEPTNLWKDVKHDPVEQKRREYAREHYITHFYYALEWQQLFKVLDEGLYGRSKVHYDPSTRLYVQDLDLGRQAASWDGWTLEEGMERLSNLCRYMLLRSSLASRADRYPLAAFRALVLLKRSQEAIGLAELLTDPVRKSLALLVISQQMKSRQDFKEERTQLLLRAHEVAYLIEENDARVSVFRELCRSLAEVEQWERAEMVAREV